MGDASLGTLRLALCLQVAMQTVRGQVFERYGTPSEFKFDILMITFLSFRTAPEIYMNATNL